MLIDKNNLSACREQIDLIDASIYQLLESRARFAQQIAQAKNVNSDQTNYYRPEREAFILWQRLQKQNGLLHSKDIIRIYQTIMNACLNVQAKQSIAFLGPLGTFSQQAVLHRFGNAAELVACDSIAQSMYAVESDTAHYAVVPLLNSSAGVVAETFELLCETKLKVTGNIYLPIQQHLWRHATHMAQPTLEKIYAHAMTFKQCDQWLTKHHPTAKLITVASNSAAVAIAANEPSAAAIAGDIVAHYYPVVKVANSIMNFQNNVTRFVLLSKQLPMPTGYDSTLLLVPVQHSMAIIESMLATLLHHTINICRTGEKENLCLLEIAGHHHQAELNNLLQDLEKKYSTIKLLGSYPNIPEG